MNIFYRIDVSIFEYLNHWVRSNVLLDNFIIFSAAYLIFIFSAVPIVLLAFPYLKRFQSKRDEYKKLFWEVLAAAITACLVIAEPMRVLIARQRPFEILEGVQTLIEHSAGKSFPSRHATLAFAIAMAIFLRYPKLGAISLALATLVSISRVVAGVHWPSDVLTGAVIGSTVAIIVARIRTLRIFSL